MLRLDYLKAHKKALCTTLLMKDELNNHLVSVSKNAENLLNNLMESYKKSDEKLSEKSKEINQLKWVKLMNNYKNTEEKIILKELRIPLIAEDTGLNYGRTVVLDCNNGDYIIKSVGKTQEVI